MCLERAFPFMQHELPSPWAHLLLCQIAVQAELGLANLTKVEIGDIRGRWEPRLRSWRPAAAHLDMSDYVCLLRQRPKGLDSM